ncbi:MAG TPA: hypothetical protein VFO76_07120, partial [Candidatus Kapabacteria bacterium]|nr:hypothetical protein [Candidatus Kapabacteria bacterium]
MNIYKRQISLFKNSVLLFAVLFIISILLNTRGWGQVYTPVPYNFQNPMFFSGGDVDGNADNHATNIISLAANGYGQWAVTDKGEWMLLGNHLVSSDAVQTPVTPPGIVEMGSFVHLGPTLTKPDPNVKVVANLKGSVRYVGLKYNAATGKPMGFYIEGFDDSHASLISNRKININLADMYGTASTSRHIITSLITSYPDADIDDIPNQIFKMNIVTANSGTPNANSNPPNTDQGNPFHLDPYFEPDWRDFFDVAIDAKYLYIVWESIIYHPAPNPNPNGDSPFLEWYIQGVAVNLSDGLVAQSFTGVNSLIPSNNGACRATVACDVRANPSLPTFDVAAISIDNNAGPHFKMPVYMRVVNNSKSLVVNLLKKDDSDPAHDYGYASHARILVGSVPGLSPAPRGMYVLRDDAGAPNDPTALIFYTPTSYSPTMSWASTAHYVDGKHYQTRSGTAAPYDGAPYHTSSPFFQTYTPVVNHSIIAFANPYDG